MSALVEATDLAIAGRLKRTSLTLEAGQIVCLVGPNGSGKTSLLHALAGIRPSSGSVRIGGLDPMRLGPDARQRLFTYLPASRDIRWPLIAADLIALGLPPGCDAGPVAERLKLGDLLEKRVDRLSTGERSRILIARALAPDPALLLLDEPIANLDPLWQLRLMDNLRALAHGEGKAILLAVHDLEIARAYADRLIVMNEGRIEADGDPERLLAGAHIPDVFGIEWKRGRWRPVD
jgi:iron complex transport system ATP-binding protein